MSDVVSEPVVHAQPLAIASDARPRGKKMMPCAAPQQRGKQWWGGKQSVMPMSDFSGAFCPHNNLLVYLCNNFYCFVCASYHLYTYNYLQIY